jgi:hypothetical protein
MTSVQIIKGSIIPSHPFCPWLALQILARTLSRTLFFWWWNFAPWWIFS